MLRVFGKAQIKGLTKFDKSYVGGVYSKFESFNYSQNFRITAIFAGDAFDFIEENPDVQSRDIVITDAQIQTFYNKKHGTSYPQLFITEIYFADDIDELTVTFNN